MKPLLAAAALSAALAGPASATEWVICGDGEEKVSFEVLLGSLDVIAIDTIRISADGRQWSTKPDAGMTKVEVGQAFDTGDQMWIDVLSEGMGGIVARLRLFTAHEEPAGEGEPFDATGGILHMPGIGAWAVSCSGP